MSLSLPTLSEMRVKPLAQPKDSTRAELAATARKDDEKRLQAWRRDVWIRDQAKDRYTGQKVIKTICLDLRRGECHHVEPRENRATRFDPRNGLLVSLATHQLIEQHKLKIVGTRFFVLAGKRYVDCDHAVRFVKA